MLIANFSYKLSWNVDIIKKNTNAWEREHWMDDIENDYNHKIRIFMAFDGHEKENRN